MEPGTVIGQPPFRYRMRRDWARMPAYWTLGTTHAVGEASDGSIVVHHTGPECIFIFTPDGDPVRSWGADYHPGAHGMAIRFEEGRDVLYLAASKAAVVVKATLSGDELMRLGVPPRPDIYGGGRIYKPTSIAVASTGTIYVADGYGQNWIHRYAKDGSYEDSFGGGGGPAQLNCPHGITIDTRSGTERLIVADRANHQLKWFSLDGSLEAVSAADLRLPCIAHPHGERLFVADLHSRVSILDESARVLAHLGDWPDRWSDSRWPNIPTREWSPKRFSSPHDLHVDRYGNIYVAEWLSSQTGCLTKLEALLD